MDQPNSQPVIDIDALQRLQVVMRERFPTLIGMYLKEADKLLETISEGLNTHDIAKAGLAAHSLKTASGQVGAMRMQSIMQAIENQAATEESDEIKKLLADAQHQFEKVKHALSGIVH